MKSNHNYMFKKSLAIVLVAAIALLFTFCKKSDSNEPDPATPELPDINPVNGHLPNTIIPDELSEAISERFWIYEGQNPPTLDNQYVSKPHRLLFATSNFNPDTVIYFSDRYLAFICQNGSLNFFGKQWDPEIGKDDEEARYGLKIIGDTTAFTCYYLTVGQPNGYYAMQSTIFSGILTDEGLKNFQVAVILLETSGNPNLEEKNSYRILGDEDGLAEDTTWFSKKSSNLDFMKVSDEDAFRMFRKSTK